MQIRFTLLASLIALTTTLGACRKEKDTAAPAPAPDNTPQTFAHGTTTGAAATFTVGSDGGTISSPDSRMKIIIPPGALATETAISIQPVSNTLPSGTGSSYRLLPHEIRFAKPVTIEFACADAAATGLGVFYQDEAGAWRYIPRPVFNTGSKTVQVTTRHFSDWTIGHWILLTPQASEVDAGGQQRLRLVSYFDLEGELAPLTPPGATDIALGREREVPPAFYKSGSWKLIGGGTLTPGGAAATYHAPGSVTAPLEASVSVELNDPEDPAAMHMLIATISVAAPRRSGLYVSIDGAQERFFEASVIHGVQAGYFQISGHEGNDAVAINFSNAAGSHSWDKEEFDNDGYNAVQSLINDAYQVSAYYDVPGDGKYTNSPGAVVITKAWSRPGDVIEGSFSATKCVTLDDGKSRYSTIKGHFRGNPDE